MAIVKGGGEVSLLRTMKCAAGLLVSVTCVLGGCKPTANEVRPGASPVFFVVKDIQDRYQSVPSAFSSSYSEVEVTVEIGCRSKEPVRFDQLQSVFYAGSKPMSAASYVLRKDNKVRAYYAQEGQLAEPPAIPAEGMFEIAEGWTSTFVLASANSNFGLLQPGSDRKVVVTMKRQGQTAYGPFAIQLPWPH